MPAWTVSQTPHWPLDSSSPFAPDNFVQDYQSNLPFHQVSLLFKNLQWFFYDLRDNYPRFLPTLPSFSACHSRSWARPPFPLWLLSLWIVPEPMYFSPYLYPCCHGGCPLEYYAHTNFCLFVYFSFFLTKTKPTCTHTWSHPSLSCPGSNHYSGYILFVYTVWYASINNIWYCFEKILMAYFISPCAISFFAIILFLKCIPIDVYESNLSVAMYCFFLNIRYIIHPFLDGWAFRLFPIFGYCEQCYNEYP